MVIETFVPSHKSMAVGGVNVHALPHSTTRLDAQMSTGGVVSITVTVWLQVSVPRQVRVALKLFPQKPARFVIVLTTVTVRFVPPQKSVTVGGVNVHAAPHSTTRSGAQMRLAKCRLKLASPMRLGGRPGGVPSAGGVNKSDTPRRMEGLAITCAHVVILPPPAVLSQTRS